MDPDGDSEELDIYDFYRYDSCKKHNVGYKISREEYFVGAFSEADICLDLYRLKYSYYSDENLETFLEGVPNGTDFLYYSVNCARDTIQDMGKTFTFMQ